jgi:L-alanine-DL-glutamate epimerase-like enolase superfamily enzyme
VDANGGYGRKQAVRMARAMKAYGVSWFEEPVTSDDLAGVSNTRHIEYFHDHSRIENTLFDGALSPRGGALRPDPARPGFGIELEDSVAGQFRVT